MSLQEFRDLLLTVTDAVYHFEAAKEKEEYIVWQELKDGGLYGSDNLCEKVKKVQVDFFTKKEFPEMLERLKAALKNDCIAYDEPIPSFDPETKQFRYIIECEVV